MDDALSRNVRLAVATGAALPEVIAVAIASAAPATLREAIALLEARADEIDAIVSEGGAAQARRPADLEPELRFDPELARVRPDIRDHEIRGRLLFGEMLGRWSFFQVAVWAIAGIELSRRDAEYVEQLGIVTQLLDAQIWPLAVTRRIAAGGAPLARSLVGAMATLFTPRITVEPVGAFLRFLDRAEARLDAGESLDAFLSDVLAAGETLPGFGRPVLGPDERVPHKISVATRFGHGDGESLGLALAIESIVREKKGLQLNAAGVQAALLRDLGLSARQATALCAIYFFIPALAQATFSAEEAERRASGGAPSR